MTSLTAGVIGCGGIARFHFSGLAKAGVRVKWVCDISEAAARPWADRLGARYTRDYRELIADAEVDLVSVLAVSPLHKPMCLDAIAAGKAVICEKTLAENADHALEIVRLAEKRQTLFYTSYMKRFIPAVEQAKALLPSLGRIMTTRIQAHQPWGDVWGAVPTSGFLAKPADGPSEVVRKYGGGVLVCGGSHILDLVLFLLGRPSRLYAAMHTPAGMDFDLQAAALLETENGVVHYEALAHPLRRIGFLRDGWDEQIEISGVHGRLQIDSAKWDEVEYKASRLRHYDDGTGRVTEYCYGAVSPFDRAVAFFCGQIRKGEQGAQSRLTGYEVDELIAHVQRSAATGRAVDVGWRMPESGSGTDA